MAEGSARSAEHCVGAHWETAHPAHLRRHGREAKAFVRKLAETGHMLADDHAGAEQLGMYGTRAAAGVVDIVAVDPDQQRAIVDQPLRRLSGKERILDPVAIRPPVP